MRLLKQDFKIGAIYVLGVRRGFDGDTLTRLLVERAKLTKAEAARLSEHWIGTEPYRRPTTASQVAD